MANRQGTNAFEFAIGSLQELCRDLTDSNRPFGFRHKASQHDAQFLKILEGAQEGYFSAKPSEHFEYVSKLVDWTEKYFRKFLYATCVLSFGLEKYFDNIPRNQQKDAYKNAKNRELYSTVFNQFDGFTRSQYRAVFTEKSLTKEIIMDRIPIVWETDDKALFFNLFAEESIATSHNQERAFSPLVRERYEKLCSMCERIVAALNDFLGAVTCDLPIINVDNRTAIQNIENCVFKFGMSAKRGEQMPRVQQRFSVSRWSGSSILLQRKPK